MSLVLPQLIPAGTYRIRAAKEGKTDRYMEYQFNGKFDVRPIVSNPSSDAQKWQIKGNTGTGAANTYTLTNVASRLNLSFRKDKDRDGNDIFRVSAFTDGSNWTIEPRGDTFVIGWEGNEQCVDYADLAGEEWLILWKRNNLPNQRWTLEPVPTVDLTSVPGHIKVVNSSGVDVEARVSTFSTNGGNTNWFTLAAGASDTWTRTGSEDVMIRVKGSGDQEPGAQTSGVFAASGSVVRYIGPAHPGLIVTK